MGTVTDTGDDELLAPAAAPAPEADDLDEDEEAAGDGGSGDIEGIVRVWLEDGRLTKVRVSPIWHVKLGRRTLEDCFTEALALASFRVAPAAPLKQSRYDDADFGQLPRLGAQSFAAFQSLFDDVEKRWDDALLRRDENPTEPRPATVGTYKGVTVTLDEAGWANRVSFDKAWLDGAQAGTICTQVMRAAEVAYDRHTPEDDIDSELDDLQSEHEYLQAAFKAMLNPKE